MIIKHFRVFNPKWRNNLIFHLALKTDFLAENEEIKFFSGFLGQIGGDLLWGLMGGI